MATANKTKAAESEKDAKTADAADETKVEEKEVPTSAEKVEKDEESAVFDEDAEYSDEDFKDDGKIEGAEGTVVEANVDGDQFDVPYVHIPNADIAPRTSDSDDPGKSWSAQENDLSPATFDEGTHTPGQTFRVGELPDRKVAEAAGINYDQFVAGLPVRPNVPHEAPRKGIPA